MVVIYLSLDVPDREETRIPLKRKLRQLDAPGTTSLVPGVWDNGQILALLTLAGVLLVAFAASQVFLPAIATLPPRIFKQRSVISGFCATFCINSGNYVFIYFLPNLVPVHQGIHSRRIWRSNTPSNAFDGRRLHFDGIINSRIGYYTPPAIIGTCIMCAAAGLLTTFQFDTGFGEWIGYQILYGLGFGLCFQVPNLAAQTCLPKIDVPTGVALILFGSLIGASVFVSVGENVLSSQPVKRLLGLPGFDPSIVTSGGVTSLLDSLSEDLREKALVSYAEALGTLFIIGLILACLATIGTFSLEWKTVKQNKMGKTGAEDARPTGNEVGEEKK